MVSPSGTFLFVLLAIIAMLDDSSFKMGSEVAHESAESLKAGSQYDAGASVASSVIL